MRQKVLLLTQFFPPETNAGANRIGPMAAVLSRRFNLVVMTLEPSYPSPELFEKLPLERYDSKRPYTIKRTFTFLPHKGSLLIRTLREQLMSLRLAARALLVPADIVVASSPSMFLGPVALILAKVKGARFVWDIRDVTWGYAKEMVGASWLMELGLQVLEKCMVFVLRHADLIVGASNGISKVAVKSGAAPDRVVTIPNGISSDMLNSIVNSVGNKAKDQRPVVAYAGLIGYNQSLGVLVDVARALPDVDFVLAGDGPELSLLKRKAKELGVGNVSFKGYLNREKLLQLYAECDILIGHAKSTSMIDATMVPVKLFEYMAAGKPIVYAGKGIATELLSELGCAVIVPPEDPESMRIAIAALLRDPEQMRSLGDKGRSSVRRDFDRDKLMEELARALDERFATLGGVP